MSKELSLHETEAIIVNFQSGGSLLADYLKELSDVSKIKLPSQAPSIDGLDSNVRNLRSAKKGMIIFAVEAAIIAAAATSAAALSGIGPKPIVKFVKSTAEVVSQAVEKVATLVTGGNANTPEPAPDSAPTAFDPLSTPTPTPTPTPTQSNNPAPESSPVPVKPVASPTPTVKTSPKPTGIGVPSPTKGSNDDDDESNDDESNDGESDDDENTSASPTSKPKSTSFASPMASPTKKSESSESSNSSDSNEGDDDDEDEEDD